MKDTIIKGYCIENSAVTLMARVRDNLGAYITQAATSSVTCKVFDLTDETLVASPTLVKTDCVFDALQTDARWTIDGTGFNLGVRLSGDNFPEGDRTYQVEIKVTPTAGEAFYVVYDLDVTNIFSE